jgi:hypothetical protein
MFVVRDSSLDLNKLLYPSKEVSQGTNRLVVPVYLFPQSNVTIKGEETDDISTQEAGTSTGGGHMGVHHD